VLIAHHHVLLVRVHNGGTGLPWIGDEKVGPQPGSGFSGARTISSQYWVLSSFKDVLHIGPVLVYLNGG